MYNQLTYNKLIFSHHVSEHESADNFSSHQHDVYELLFITDGEGTFVIEDTAYNFQKNTVFLIPPAQYHVLKIPPQQTYDRFLIYFPPELFPECARTEENLHQAADERVRALFYKIDEYADTFSHEQMRVLLLAALSELLILLTSGEAQQGAKQVTLPAVVKRAIDFINNNLGIPLTIGEVAKHAYVSNSYLSHIFYKTMQISVARYIRLKKMYAARNLIKQNYPVVYIAQSLGYENYSTFLRAYRAEFGKTPSCDREQD